MRIPAAAQLLCDPPTGAGYEMMFGRDDVTKDGRYWRLGPEREGFS